MLLHLNNSRLSKMNKKDESIGRLMAQSLKWLVKDLKLSFNKNGLNINFPQFALLNLISSKDDLILNDIAVFTGKDKSAIMRHLDHLEESKYIIRVPNIEDRRKKNIVMTKNGYLAVEQGKEIEEEVIANVFAEIEEKDIEIFKSVLLRIIKNE